MLAGEVDPALGPDDVGLELRLLPGGEQGEGTGGEAALASSAGFSRDAVRPVLAFMLAQGYAKTARSDSEFKITVLGSDFLRDYAGMRKFLS